MLGIDVSKATLDCTLLDPKTRQALWHRTYENTSQGVKRLLKATQPDCIWALEPTGSYSTDVVKIARAAGRDVRLAEPRRAKQFLRSIQSRAKCDRLDSAGLGLYALCSDLPPYPIKSDFVEHLDQLLKARKGLSLSIQQLEAQMRSLPRATSALKPAIEALKQQRDQIDRDLKKLSSPKTPPAAAATPPAAAATPEAPVVPGQAGSSAAASSAAASSAAASSAAASVIPGEDAAAVQACVRRLLKVPGIGPVTAHTVAVRLIGRSFPHSDSFVAYCGLDIAVKQSGQKRGDLGLTKQGDGELRRLFYLCAQSSLQSKDSPFKAHYERELAKGLTTTGALCAVARKIARLCWSLVQHNQEYDPDRVYKQKKQPPNP